MTTPKYENQQAESQCPAHGGEVDDGGPYNGIDWQATLRTMAEECGIVLNDLAQSQWPMLEKSDRERVNRLHTLFARIAALPAQLSTDAEGEPWFPLLGTPFAIRRDMLNEAQAKRNHSQTLDRLAERGGLDPAEACAIMERRAFRNMKNQQAFAALIAAHAAEEPQA